jgi:hypothetical protein
LLVAFLAAAVAWLEGGRRRHAWAVAGLSVACVLTHLLAWGFGVGCGLVMVGLLPGIDLRDRLRRAAPFLAALPLVAVWAGITLATSETVHMPTVWNVDLGDRLAGVPAALFGPGPLAYVALTAAALALGLGSRGAQRAPWRYVPLAAVALAMLGPERLAGTWHTGERFVALLLPSVLLVLKPRLVDAPRRRLSRGLLVAVACGVPLALVPRWAPLASDVGDLRAAAAQVPEGATVYTFVAERSLPGLDAEVASHLPALVQVERDVWIDYTFCRVFNILVRLKNAEPDYVRDPRVATAEPAYGYALIRSPRDPGEYLPALAAKWERVGRRGVWWCYRRR